MFLITDKSGRYLKTTVDKVNFVSNQTLADTFDTFQSATNYINSKYSKKRRKNYKVVEMSSGIIESNKKNDSDISALKELTHQGVELTYPSLFSLCSRSPNAPDKFEEIVRHAINVYISPEIERYTKQLQEFDGKILDLRHFLRHPDTKLNACQACKFTLQLQKLERDREACKKELQRLAMLRSDVYKSFKEAKNFEYDDYKSRQIEDVAGYLFTA